MKREFGDTFEFVEEVKKANEIYLSAVNPRKTLPKVSRRKQGYA